MAEDTTAETIRDNALAPKRVQVDGQTVEQHSIADQIAADKYAKSKEATAAGKGLGVRYAKFVPPGAS